MDGKRTIYIATGEGVICAVHDGAAAHVEHRGLEGKGLVRWLAVDRDDPARLYAATDGDGVWRSDDGGRNWSEKNDGLLYKHTFCLAQHPETRDLYVGTEPAAIFRSSDGGDRWTQLDGLRRMPNREDWTFPGPPFIPHVKCLSLCDADPDTIFGAVEEGWLIRSTDGGATWENIREGTEFDSHTVTIMPNDPRIVVSTSGKGVYRSDDGGKTFADASDGINYRYLTHVAVHPSRPDVLFTAGAEVSPPHWARPGGAGCEIYRSEDAGKSWQRLEGGLADRLEAAPRAVALDPADPDTVLVGLHDGDVWMTSDGGESFGKILEGLPPVLGIRVAAG